MVNWTTACPDWGDRIKTGRSIIPPPIFPEQAEQALAIFKELKIVDAPGSPTFGESCAQWVFDLVASIFGAYDATSGRRLIQEWFVLIPKKNSKSTLAAGIMMTAMILNWRQSAGFTVLAPTVEVAGNAFSPARDMVRKDEELDALMHVQGHIKTITNRDTNATLKVLAADQNTVGGIKSVGTLIDELHLFGKQIGASAMFVEAIGGLASRPEGFVIYLTTQSDEPPAGVFKEKLDYARDVRDGIIHDPHFVPVIFEHPVDIVEKGGHLLLENLAMVNPNIGFSVDNVFLEREFKKAKDTNEAAFRGFMAKHGNVEIGLNLRSDRWAGADYWERQGRPHVTFDYLMTHSDIVDVGIDGGGLDDLLGLALIGREPTTGRWLHWGHAWAHPSVMERRKSEAARFKDFANDGDLTLVAHVGDDVVGLVAVIKRVYEAGLLDKIGVDQHGIGSIIDALVAEGIPEDLLVGISQGWKLQGAIKTVERKLAEGKFIHGGRPLMAWSVGNARIIPAGNAIAITKQASGFAKIDPLMALLDAAQLMSLNPEAGGLFDDFISNPLGQK